MHIFGREAKFNIGDQVQVQKPRDKHNGETAAVRSIAAHTDRFTYDLEFGKRQVWYEEHELLRGNQ